MRRDYAGRRDTFKGHQKKKERKKKLPPNLIKLLVMERLYMSPQDTHARLNFVVPGSLSWLTLYLTTVQLVWNLIESIPTALSGLSANVYSHPPLSLLTDGAGDTWTATRLHLLKLHPRRSTHRKPFTAPLQSVFLKSYLEWMFTESSNVGFEGVQE